ncbi:MAG: hypothetical protein H8D67_17305 [Deltaproteobacteria bacterium]|nr:hypothetical protein [Deltaproteobacteria bacterium]MBL7075342.1 hypothetical protein [candidate division KSB1 bacterium]
MNGVEWERLGCFHKEDIGGAVVSFGGYIPFELVIFDTTSLDHSAVEKFAIEVKENLPYMGNRILILIRNSEIPASLNGLERTCAICCKDDVCKSLNSKPPELWPGILHYMWLKGISGRSDWKVHINLDVWEKDRLTDQWKNIESNISKFLPGISLTALHKKREHDKSNESNGNNPDLQDHSIVFDRHAVFWYSMESSLKDLSFKGHYEEWGINSPLYLSLFNPPESVVAQIDLVVGLLETSFFKILVVDERIGEKALDSTSANMERFKMLANMGVFIVTHVGDTPVGKDISEQAFSLTIHNNTLSLMRNGKEYKQFHFLVIHQGVIENEEVRAFLEKGLGLDKNCSPEDLVRKISHYVPFVVIDSGRGIPANMPQNAKFLTFSALQDMILRKNPAKYQLIQILLRLTRRKR